MDYLHVYYPQKRFHGCLAVDSIMFFVSALAETNRVPFDLTEGESELVSGYNVEYSSMSFAFFFLKPNMPI